MPARGAGRACCRSSCQWESRHPRPSGADEGHSICFGLPGPTREAKGNCEATTLSVHSIIPAILPRDGDGPMSPRLLTIAVVGLLTAGLFTFWFLGGGAGLGYLLLF